MIIVSADAEWQAVRKLFPGMSLESSPYEEWFFCQEENIDLIIQRGMGKDRLIARLASMRRSVGTYAM